MEWVETTGRTIAEALDAALDELGVDEEDVEYEVLEEPKSGFLGRLGSSEGRIRARVKPISREKPGERQRRNRRGSSGDLAATAGGSGRERRSERRVRSGGGERLARSAGRRGRGRAARRRAGVARRRRRRQWRRQRGIAAARVGNDARKTSKQGSNVETIEPDVTIEEQAAAAERFTQGLVDAFDLGAQAKSVIDDEVVVVDVTGENLGLLVGPQGRDPQRDRGAGAHGRAAPDRRSRRAHPRRRRRLPGQAPRGARPSSPATSPRRCSRPARPRRSSRCRRATARSCTTPPPRSTASPRCPRARTRADAWSCARPDHAHAPDGRDDRP